jgi:TetR/AcrR family transcriptional regulator, transcriptional repressor for nem operon
MPRRPGPAREGLLDAAQDLLRERGYEGAGLDDVCGRAGVAKGALFYHFASKEALAVAAVERFFARLVRRGQEAMGDPVPTDPAEALFRYVGAVVALLHDPLMSRGCLLGAMAMETPGTHPGVAAAAEAALGRWRASIAGLIAAAAAQRDVAVDAESLADGLLAAIEGGLLLDRRRRSNSTATAALMAFRHYLEMTIGGGER